MNVTKTLLASAMVASTGLHPTPSRATEYQHLPGDVGRASAGLVSVATGACLPLPMEPRPLRASSAQLQLEILFDSGDDQLTRQNRHAIQILAHFLLEHPHLAIRLDGFADPRGTDEYNNVLSDYRARAVEEALVVAGVTPERIERRAHGAGITRAMAGNYQSYSLERRVDIHIYDPAEPQALTATPHILATAI